jgi:hypothetical protein
MSGAVEQKHEDRASPSGQSPIPEAITAGLAAVEGAVQALASGEPLTCSDVGRVFDTAVEHGAPIWNRGSQLGCAQVYLHAARALVARLQPLTPPAPAIIHRLLEALAQIVEHFPSATPENANRLGWTLRGTFDRFHAARGMEAVDALTAAIRRAGCALDLELVTLPLKAAISHGNILYKADALDACALLHCHTARQVLDLLADPERPGGPLAPALRRVRRDLSAILTSHPTVTEDNAKPLAWELYEAFQNILHRPQTEAASQPARKYDGFISYRRSGGSDAALAIRAHLQLRGLNTFLDVEGLDSGAFGPQLLREIEQTPSFLLILTPGSLDRCQQPGDWLRQEIAHAIQTRRNLIPILKDSYSFPPASALPPDLCALPGYQAVPYVHDFFPAVIDRIEQYMRSTAD